MDRNLLKQVIIEQHEIGLPIDFHSREIDESIRFLEVNPEVILISGLRRCGKSTVMKHFRQKSKGGDYFINFEDERLIDFDLADFQMLHEVFIELYGEQKIFYIDEIQNISGWERFVRRLRGSGYKVYITGSNAQMFSLELGTKLTGRYIDVAMFPYSFREYLQHKDRSLFMKNNFTGKDKGLLLNIYREYLEVGGIPEYVKYKQKQYLHDLYRAIIYRDIISRHNIKNEKGVLQLVFYLASNIGKEVSYSRISKLLGIPSVSSISDYCHYLENSYLCYFISRYSHSVKKQIQYNKKCYFVDHALAKVVGFRPSEDHGRLLENVIFIDLKRRGEEVYFHKERKECDFILRRDGRIHLAIQVSIHLSNPKTYERELDGLIEAMQSYELSKGVIITENEEGVETVMRGDQKFTVEIVPVWKWLLDRE